MDGASLSGKDAVLAEGEVSSQEVRRTGGFFSVVFRLGGSPRYFATAVASTDLETFGSKFVIILIWFSNVRLNLPNMVHFWLSSSVG